MKSMLNVKTKSTCPTTCFCNSNTQFIICEISRAKDLSSQPGSCFKIVEENTELIGYKAGVIRDWILDTSRYVL